METPIMIFDHVNKAVAKVPAGPAADPKVREMLASQREQTATASGMPRQ